MLGKLIKHEFRATGRLMAPLFGALLLLAVFSRVANQILQQVPNPTRVLYIVSVLLAIVYVLAGLGVMVFSTVLMIKRFHQNFLTDEGYLMFTLPVSVHSLLEADYRRALFPVHVCGGAAGPRHRDLAGRRVGRAI